MNIMEFTLSSLLRRKVKNTAVFVFYTLLVFFVASTLFFAAAIKEETLFVLQDSPEIIVQRLVAGRHEPIPLDCVETLKKIEGVQSVSPRLWGYYYDPTNRANYTLMVSEDLSTTPGMAIIGNGVARLIIGNENQTMPFKSPDGSFIFLRIKGIMNEELDLMSSDIILMNEADFVRLFDYPQNYATDIALTASDPEKRSTISAAINRLFPESRTIVRDEILGAYEAFLGWRGGLVSMVISGALLALFILVSDRAMGSGVEESKEVGILKALGWETYDIMLMKFWEGAIVSLLAFLVGILLAYLHVFFGSALIFKVFLQGWAVLFPQLKLTPFVRLSHVFIIFCFTVLPYILVTVAPFWKIATVDPDSVMRR